MAIRVQLENAARQVRKSEVTVRRLIKAGKVPFEKQKTLTGFIYLVDPDEIRHFYQNRGVVSPTTKVETEKPNFQPKAEPDTETPVKRVAISDETGNSTGYWQKRSDLYEERYNQEMGKHAQAREELGVWRGRAEQTQSMLMKLLPAPENTFSTSTGTGDSSPFSVKEEEKEASVAQTVMVQKENYTTLISVVAILITLIVFILLGAAYLKYTG